MMRGDRELELVQFLAILNTYDRDRRADISLLALISRYHDPRSNTIKNAARAGNLEMVKWLRERGRPWNKETCEIAAREGHTELFEWARDNGCPCYVVIHEGRVYNEHELLQMTIRGLKEIGAKMNIRGRSRWRASMKADIVNVILHPKRITN